MRLAPGIRVVACAALALCGCAEKPARETSPAADGGPAQQVVDLVLRESEQGRLRWVLRADTALAYGEGEPTQLRGLHLDFYNATGDSVRSTLTAREGEVTEARRDLVARGSVVVETPAGHRLETEELRFDHEANRVFSPLFVRLTRGGSVLTGIGLESDPELRSVRILSEVEAGVREGEQILNGF